MVQSFKYVRFRVFGFVSSVVIPLNTQIINLFNVTVNLNTLTPLPLVIIVDILSNRKFTSSGRFCQQSETDTVNGFINRKDDKEELKFAVLNYGNRPPFLVLQSTFYAAKLNFSFNGELCYLSSSERTA